jgi:hypothetical protein
MKFKGNLILTDPPVAHKSKKKDCVPRWEAEPMYERLQRCLSMLVIHGILPDHIRDKARTRIVRRFHPQAAIILGNGMGQRANAKLIMKGL